MASSPSGISSQGEKQKLTYASLHDQLRKEQELHSEPAMPNSTTAHGSEDEEEAKKLEDRYRWEEDAFSPTEIDEDELRWFLKDAFVRGTDRKPQALDGLSKTIREFEKELASPHQMDTTTIDWVISGLLASDLPSPETRETLRSYKHDKLKLSVIPFVLNMEMRNLYDWSWGDSVLVDHRRNADGTYTVFLDEGVLQAMLLQYIGVKWSVFFKKAFRSFQCAPGGPWLDHDHAISRYDKRRREYFCGACETEGSVQHMRDSMYREHVFVTRLMDHETQGLEAKQSDNAEGSCPIEANERRQTLLQILAAEVTMSEGQHKIMRILCSSFDRWDRLIPHATIRHVLSFLGVSQKWLDFFLKFLEVPVRFPGDPVDTVTRTCRRGMPCSHVLSDVLGEAVLFCLDVSVTQRTGGGLMYRLYNDMWFWSSEANLIKRVWATIQIFAAVTGARIYDDITGVSNNRNGRVRLYPGLPKQDFKMGFFKMCHESSGLGFDVNAVSRFIRELRKQLRSTKSSILSFVQTWNSYNKTFFSDVAKLVQANGRPKDFWIAYRALFDRDVFIDGLGDNDERDLISYLRAVLRQRYGIVDIPNAFFFFPSELGGLELMSGLIPIREMWDSTREKTLALFEEFREAELKAYHQPKPTEARDHMERSQRVVITRKDPFFSFEEYTRWREQLRYGFDGELADLYRGLLGPSLTEGSYYDKTGLKDVLAASSDDDEVLRAIKDGNCPGIGLYWKRIVDHYGPKVMEQFGTLTLTDVAIEIATEEE